MNIERDELDGVVNFLVEHLSQRLVEAKLFHGVKDRVESLHRELTLINIQNSEGRWSEHPIVKEVVEQIRDVAFEAEDVIDKFILKVGEQRKRNCMGKLIYSFNHAIMHWVVAKKIEGLNKDINKIYSNKDKYVRKALVTVDTSEVALHKRRREVEEDDVVGFVDDSRILVMQLTDKGYPNRDVVSIIGMGGLGKTVLARKIYNEIKECFDYHAWVYVSQDFKTRELFIKILKKMSISDELRRNLEVMSEDELKERLFQYLRGKRYLVVMDDIWKTEVWDNVRSVFPDNSNGSRILITSRIKEVGLHAGQTFDPYFLKFLNADQSLKLFHKKVFRGGQCPPELEPLARQIVEGCNGFPLSIVVLASILSTKDMLFHIWSRFVGQVNQILTHDSPVCKQILSLSYTDLSQHLKPCFLYFSVYPEGFEIPVRQLIHLWMAEGFIQQTGDRHMEDVAEEYLEQLINRSLVQDASRRTDGGIKTCRINNLLRELYMSESAEEKFLEVCTDVSTNKSRRLSIQGSPRRCISSNPSDPTRAHTLLFFGKDKGEFNFNTDALDWVVENFKLIRVLHFEHLELHSIPERIGTLKYLRYLRINLSNAVRVPDSIGNLTKLETLYIKGNLEEGCLPNGIFKLERLRNLYLNGKLPLPYHVDQALWNLQVLSTATLCCDFQRQILGIVGDRFPRVRKLKIQLLLESDMNDQGNGHEQREFDRLSRLHHLGHLEILRIENCPMLPTSLPDTITKLTLKAVDCGVGGGLKVLGELPNLLILKIQSCPVDDGGLHIISDSFLKLQVLKLEGLTLREWELGTGAMPVLRHLVFKNLGHLSMLPQELPNLTALRNVEVLESNLNLVGMLQELEMIIGFKLLIIPSVGA